MSSLSSVRSVKFSFSFRITRASLPEPVGLVTMATIQAVKPLQATNKKQESITLKGSAALVSDYLHCAINSILYMRGVYPAEMFESVQKYGMCIFDAKDDELKKYLDSVMKWARDWMVQEVVTGIVLVITNPASREIMERWQFDVVCDKEGLDEDGCAKPAAKGSKPKPAMEEIRRQVGSVLKQIVASVSILPAASSDYANSFNILVYTKDNLDVPADWQESNPHHIPNAQQLRFRKIQTSIHQVDTCVTYRADDI